MNECLDHRNKDIGTKQEDNSEREERSGGRASKIRSLAPSGFSGSCVLRLHHRCPSGTVENVPFYSKHNVPFLTSGNLFPPKFM